MSSVLDETWILYYTKSCSIKALLHYVEIVKKPLHSTFVDFDILFYALLFSILLSILLDNILHRYSKSDHVFFDFYSVKIWKIG